MTLCVQPRVSESYSKSPPQKPREKGAEVTAPKTRLFVEGSTAPAARRAPASLGVRRTGYRREAAYPSLFFQLKKQASPFLLTAMYLAVPGCMTNAIYSSSSVNSLTEVLVFSCGSVACCSPHVAGVFLFFPPQQRSSLCACFRVSPSLSRIKLPSCFMFYVWLSGGVGCCCWCFFGGFRNFFIRCRECSLRPDARRYCL